MQPTNQPMESQLLNLPVLTKSTEGLITMPF